MYILPRNQLECRDFVIARVCTKTVDFYTGLLSLLGQVSFTKILLWDGYGWVRTQLKRNEASRVCNPPTVICQAQSDTDFVQESPT